MKPSEKCKEAGLKSLAELSDMTDVSVQTLNNWFKDKPALFDIVLTGAACKKGETKVVDIYRVHANYPEAMSAEVFDGTLDNLPGIIRGELSDPENFGLEISESPLVYNDDGTLDVECACDMGFNPCTMQELDERSK